MKKLALHWQIIIGLVLGILFALLSSNMGWSKFTLDWIAPFGTIFINLLKLIAVPLVLFSIIKGIAGLGDAKKLGRLGSRTLLSYLVTTVIAVTVGLLAVNIVKPGNFIAEDQRLENRAKYEAWVAANDNVELLDDKSVTDAAPVAEEKSAEEKAIDEKVKKTLETAAETKEKGPLQFLVDMVPSNIFVSLNDNRLMLQVIFFGIFFGITLLMLPTDKVKPMSDFVDSANEVFLKMVDIVMLGAPYFVFALLAGKMAELAGDDVGKVGEIFKGLGVYSLVVVGALAAVLFAIYPIIISLFVKDMTYGKFMKGISPAQLLAFSTSSSAATLPVTMECVRDNLGVSKEVTNFVLPIGATVNMDGTSLYQAVAVVFLAQMFMVDLTIGQQLVIVLTATLASIGSAAVPGAGLVMLAIVLGSVGLNPEWIAIIIPVDRILDMCRTTVNVTGDATISTLMAASEGQLNVKKTD